MMHIILDAGHGIDTAGKRSPVWPDGSQLFEYEFNSDVAGRLRSLLLRSGVPVDIIYDADRHSDVALSERVRRVNGICEKYGPEHCLLVSVHANAGGGTGWEAFTSRGDTAADRYADIFYQWAEMSLPEFRIRKDLSDGDADKEAGFYILERSKCPAGTDREPFHG